MDKIQAGLDILFLIVDCICGYQIAEAFLEKRWNDWRAYGYPITTIISYVVFDFIRDVCCGGGDTVGEIIQWCNWLAIIVLLGIFYKGRIFSKVINIVLNIFLGTFWELIVILGVIFILHIQAGQIWSDPVLSYSIQGFSKILILISILGLKQYNGKNKNNISFNYTKELLEL